MTERRTIQINPQFLTPATANFVSAGAGTGTGTGLGAADTAGNAGAGTGTGPNRTRLFKTKPEGTPNHRKTQSLKQQFLARIKNKVAANIEAQSLPLDNASQDKALQDSMNLFKELADKRLERKKQKTLRRQLMRQQNDPLMHVATSLPPELAYVPRPAPAPAPAPAQAPAPVFRSKTKIHGNGTMLQPHVIEEPLLEEKSQEKTRVITTTAEPAVKNVGALPVPAPAALAALAVPATLAAAAPPYSNLKNGSRPTYRNWVTQKNKHHGHAQQTQGQQAQAQQTQAQQTQAQQTQAQQGQAQQGQAQQGEPVSALAKFKKNYHKSRKGFLAANVLHKQKVDIDKQKVDIDKQKLADAVVADAVVADAAANTVDSANGVVANAVVANAVVANAVVANAVVANAVASADAVVADAVAANGLAANGVVANNVAFAQKGRTPKAKRFVKTLKKYKLGKHANGKVSILIKNSQTRKRVQQEHDNLKTQPILEVKNYLRGKNLLKIGSLIPDDVARELYEAAILTGDVRNQSSDTLMHNFFTKE